MTNPDNIVRVRARNGGRASVYEANGWAQGYTSGLLEGHGVTQNTSADMNVLVGGSQTKPDVVLAENPAGYRIALDLVGQQAVAITAPATNSRISAIVAYTDDLSLTTTEDTVTGSPASCGLIVVNGTASVSPTPPTDNEIRTAITADGATGSQAAYAIIATIEVANDATVITNSLITTNKATISADNIDFSVLGDQTSYFDIGALRIQFGHQTGGKPGSNTTVILPVSFADNNYTAVVSNQYNESGSSRWYAFVTSKTASSFTYRSGFLQQGSGTVESNTNNVLNWVAIGLKP